MKKNKTKLLPVILVILGVLALSTCDMMTDAFSGGETVAESGAQQQPVFEVPEGMVALSMALPGAGGARTIFPNEPSGGWGKLTIRFYNNSVAPGTQADVTTNLTYVTADTANANPDDLPAPTGPAPWKYYLTKTGSTTDWYVVVKAYKNSGDAVGNFAASGMYQFKVLDTDSSKTLPVVLTPGVKVLDPNAGALETPAGTGNIQLNITTGLGNVTEVSSSLKKEGTGPDIAPATVLNTTGGPGLISTISNGWYDLEVVLRLAPANSDYPNDTLKPLYFTYKEAVYVMNGTTTDVTRAIAASDFNRAWDTDATVTQIEVWSLTSGGPGTVGQTALASFNTSTGFTSSGSAGNMIYTNGTVQDIVYYDITSTGGSPYATNEMVKFYITTNNTDAKPIAGTVRTNTNGITASGNSDYAWNIGNTNRVWYQVNTSGAKLLPSATVADDIAIVVKAGLSQATYKFKLKLAPAPIPVDIVLSYGTGTYTITATRIGSTGNKWTLFGPDGTGTLLIDGLPGPYTWQWNTSDGSGSLGTTGLGTITNAASVTVDKDAFVSLTSGNVILTVTIAGSNYTVTLPLNHTSWPTY
ncbi:hypothetical protein FACS1894161_1360 [Spirochaetia bacterium]|nr:hypothetical protein FACS1894161_1360 [Spirochaetia bacterium]